MVKDLRQTENLYIELSGEGATDLICIGARIRERLSVIPEMRMEFTAKTTTFDPKSILGKRITLKTGDEFCWTGLVISVEDVGLKRGVDVYAAELRPWLWLATIGEENRVYQNKTSVEIISDVFNKMGVSDFQSKARGTHDPREYCVQYGESNFAFVSRLMEEEGIYYLFDHSGPTEKMILVDESSALEDVGDVPFTKSNIIEGVRADADTVYEWAEAGKVVSGKVALWDYDFLLPNANLLAKKAATGVGTHSHNQIERYQSGAHYKTAEKGESFHARNVAEAHAADYARATGLCNTVKIRSGVKFSLKHEERPAVEGSYLVVGSTHYIRYDDGAAGTELTRVNRQAEQINYPALMALYEAEFEVQPAATPFRPLRRTPWPEVPSLLTALVTGPSGEEIHTDDYGRIRIIFPWDRLGEKNDTSSCWVRSVMPWTGKDWGYIAVPRIGMEVIIQFERGNIDRPICTGMVYNGVNKPPYGLPGEMNKMGWRTNSTKGGGGHHELMMDDTKGKEKIFFQSERDYQQLIKNNAAITIGMEHKDKGDLHQTIWRHKTDIMKTGNHTFTVEQGSETVTIATDQSISVGRDQSQSIGRNQTENVGADVTVTVGKNRTVSIGVNSTDSIGSNHQLVVGSAQEITIGAVAMLSVGSDRSVTIGSNATLNVGANRTEEIGGDHSETIAGNATLTVGKNHSETIGKNLKITAGDSITLEVGAASLTMKKDGTITLKGKDITVDASAKVKVKAAAQVSIKGALADVKADGVVTIKGSLTTIN